MASPLTPEAESLPPRRRWPRTRPLADLPSEVLALSAVAFLVALGFGVVAPAIPLFARHFGVSRTAAGAVISAFAGARLLAAPFAGRLVNVFGERVMLAFGIGVVAVSSFVAGLAHNYWQLLFLRGVGGVGSIMFSVSASSLLIRVTPGHLRGRAQGVFGGGFLLGAIAGPALGVIATVSLRAPFFLYAGTLVLAGTMGLASLRHSSLAARAEARGGEVLTLRTALRDRAYLATLGANLAEDWAIIGTRSALVPLFVADRLRLGSIWTYVGFFVVSIVSGALLFPAGRYVDHTGRRPALLFGLAVGAAGLGLIPALPNVLGLLLAMALLGISGAALSVASGAMLGDIVAGRGGTVVATYQMAGDIGSFAGPLVAGALADAHGYGASFGLAAVIALLPIGLVATARETRRTAETTP